MINIRPPRFLIVFCLCVLISLVLFDTVWGNDLEINGKAALLMDAHTGQILFAKNIEEKLPVASITKMMSLVLVLEAIDRGHLSFEDLVTTSHYAASMRGSHVWLEEGEQLPLKEMLYAIAVGSGNDAAVAVAEYVAGSEKEFVKLMNAKAKELGLKNTTFANASGMPAEKGTQEMTALDVALLARYAIDVPHFMDLVSTYEYTMRKHTTKRPQLWNFNKLLRRYEGVDGIKTGYTQDAGYCLAASCVRDAFRLIAVVLGSSSEANRERDIRTLLDFGYRKYTRHIVMKKEEKVGELNFALGEPAKTPTILLEDLAVTIERGQEEKITTEALYPEDLRIPIEKGAKVGSLVANYGGQKVGEANITVSQPVRRGGIFTLVLRMTTSMIESLF